MTLNNIIDKEIGAPGHGKYFLCDINARDKSYMRGEMNRLSKIITTTCESLVMIYSDSNISAVSI